MAEKSKIEWTDATFNPWIGCSKVSPGCTNCYAEVSTPVRTARAKGRELWGKGAQRQRTSEAYWKQPLKWNRQKFQFVELCDGRTFRGTFEDVAKELGFQTDELRYPSTAVFKNVFPARARVFCASLSDWLDDEVPIEWLADLLKLIYDTPNLDWLLLTKRPENYHDRISKAYEANRGMNFSWMLRGWLMAYTGNIGYEPTPNVWIGTTVEDQKRADERIPELLKIPAKVRFLSVEPMLEKINLVSRSVQRGPNFKTVTGTGWLGPEDPKIHWVIAGGESGPNKRRFDCDWARSLQYQCLAANIPFFMKQIDKVQQIPEDLMVREFPV